MLNIFQSFLRRCNELEVIQRNHQNSWSFVSLLPNNKASFPKATPPHFSQELFLPSLFNKPNHPTSCMELLHHKGRVRNSYPNKNVKGVMASPAISAPDLNEDLLLLALSSLVKELPPKSHSIPKQTQLPSQQLYKSLQSLTAHLTMCIYQKENRNHDQAILYCRQLLEQSWFVNKHCLIREEIKDDKTSCSPRLSALPGYS